MVKMHKSKKYTTTTDDFRYFCAQVEDFLDLFHLREWEACYEHVDGMDALASVQTDTGGGFAIFRLSVHWFGLKPTRAELRETAFHEVMELMLAPLSAVAFNYEIGHTEKVALTEKERHRVIRTLENVIFPKL